MYQGNLNTSETPVTFYHLTYCHMAEVLNLHEHYSENLKCKSKDLLLLKHGLKLCMILSCNIQNSGSKLLTFHV